MVAGAAIVAVMLNLHSWHNPASGMQLGCATATRAMRRRGGPCWHPAMTSEKTVEGMGVCSVELCILCQLGSSRRSPPPGSPGTSVAVHHIVALYRAVVINKCYQHFSAMRKKEAAVKGKR